MISVGFFFLILFILGSEWTTTFIVFMLAFNGCKVTIADVGSKVRPIRVAILDSGLDPKYKSLLCSGSESRSFIDDNPLTDFAGHGTLMARIIKHYSKKTPVCFIIVKFFDPRLPNRTFDAYLKGVKYISTLKNIDLVNISASGTEYAVEEKLNLEYMISKGIKIVVAAGNNGLDLDFFCSAFPACYTPDLIVVGGKKFDKGNYGKIVDIYGPWKLKSNGKIVSQGTSISTAFVSGNLVKQLGKNR